eukprot:752896-Hanusia_phi.AAC.1
MTAGTEGRAVPRRAGRRAAPAAQPARQAFNHGAGFSMRMCFGFSGGRSSGDPLSSWHSIQTRSV